ncbi:MAG: response regulator [Bdellovibrionales bacterium]|nr:response regulator [Bdellovibrionales bacterium]
MKKTILLVDDDKNILELFKEGLEDLSFDVITATDAASALKILDSKKIDCIVSDIVMPEMNGVELATIIRSKNETLPLFFITAYMDYSREDLNAFKPKAVIFKPFDIEEAALLIKNHFLRNS